MKRWNPFPALTRRLSKKRKPKAEVETTRGQPPETPRAQKQGSVVKGSELPDDNYPLW